MTNRLEQLQNLLSESPSDDFLHFAIAKEYEKLKDNEQALHYYQKLIALNPDYVGVYYHLGKLYERQEAFEKALSTYKTGMEVAKKVGDQHALSELAGARLGIEE